MTSPRQPIEIREFARPDLAPGASLLRTARSEVCGTDVHLWHGRLAGVPYPIIPGHVSAGVLESIRGPLRGLDGSLLREGDRAVFFDVHRTCGACRACTVHHTPTRCPARRVYGITDSASEGLYGGWSQNIYLEPGVGVARLPDAVTVDDYIGGGCGLADRRPHPRTGRASSRRQRPRPGRRRRWPVRDRALPIGRGFHGVCRGRSRATTGPRAADGRRPGVCAQLVNDGGTVAGGSRTHQRRGRRCRDRSRRFGACHRGRCHPRSRRRPLRRRGPLHRRRSEHHQRASAHQPQTSRDSRLLGQRSPGIFSTRWRSSTSTAMFRGAPSAPARIHCRPSTRRSPTPKPCGSRKRSWIRGGERGQGPGARGKACCPSKMTRIFLASGPRPLASDIWPLAPGLWP